MIANIVIALVLLINLHMLSTSRLGALIRDVAIQALLLCILAVFVRKDIFFWHEWLFIAVSIIVKSMLLPWLMKRALRGTFIRREIEPFVGYSTSLLLGLAILGIALWASFKLPLPNHDTNSFVLATAFFTIGIGLFLIVSRSKAITQTIGYLSMENGIYALGLALAAGNPLIVEMGVLLDVFVGVFVMGIIILHINREFNHIDTHHLRVLKD